VESISLSIAPGAVLRTFEESDSAELTAVIAGKRAQIEANDGFEGGDCARRADRRRGGLPRRRPGQLLDHAFGVWDLHRVIVEAVVDNTRSRAVPERLGFREEAVRREAKLIRGGYEDAVLYAMLAPDWSRSPAREATGSE
jgi:hypothetical protein